MIFDFIYKNYALKQYDAGYDVYQKYEGEYIKIGYVPKIETLIYLLKGIKNDELSQNESQR